MAKMSNGLGRAYSCRNSKKAVLFNIVFTSLALSLLVFVVAYHTHVSKSNENVVEYIKNMNELHEFVMIEESVNKMIDKHEIFEAVLDEDKIIFTDKFGDALDMSAFESDFTELKEFIESRTGLELVFNNNMMYTVNPEFNKVIEHGVTGTTINLPDGWVSIDATATFPTCGAQTRTILPSTKSITPISCSVGLPPSQTTYELTMLIENNQIKYNLLGGNTDLTVVSEFKLAEKPINFGLFSNIGVTEKITLKEYPRLELK